MSMCLSECLPDNPKNNDFYEGPQVSITCLLDKIRIKTKISIEHWWHETHRGTLSTEHWWNNIDRRKLSMEH
jgi:hypothetical protein